MWLDMIDILEVEPTKPANWRAVEIKKYGSMEDKAEILSLDD